MAESKRWRVVLRGKVVATFAHVDRAMERARVLARLYGEPVEVHHRPVGYQQPYRTVVRPRPSDGEAERERFLDETRRTTEETLARLRRRRSVWDQRMAADRYGGSSEPDVVMEAQGE